MERKGLVKLIPPRGVFITILPYSYLPQIRLLQFVKTSISETEPTIAQIVRNHKIAVILSYDVFT